jgi:hypothetical protein
MLWRRLCVARAWSAAGLLTCSMFASAAMAEPKQSPASEEMVTETVRILDARESGDLAVEIRGQGEDRVRFALKNTSSKRLNVILPPGLVASSTVAQGRAGPQSMGLGTPTNRAGGFGEFQDANSDAGFRSVPVSPANPPAGQVTVPAGKTVEFSVPAVCLNFGLRTPSSRDHFELVDVDNYTTDPRARKTLRTLATLGTSHGVAQAAVWRVFNGVSFDLMQAQASRIVNPHEVALAARIVEAIETAGESEVIDAAALTESALFVEVEGEGALAPEAKRLGDAIVGQHVLGLPVRAAADVQSTAPTAPALLVKLVLTGTEAGETRGRIVVNHATRGEGWTPFGKTGFTDGSTVSVIDGPALARSLDHALASAFVSVKVARRGANNTSLRVENRLPFSLAKLSIKVTGSSGTPPIAFKALGIGPARSMVVPIEAANGTIDRVSLNGL